MATIQYVVNAVDAASATFARIAGSADEMLHKLDEIGRKSETARVGLEGDKEANLTIDKLDLKMAKFAKSVAEGKIGVEGQARAMLQIRKLELEMDKLNTKRAKIHIDTSALSKLSLLQPSLLGTAAALSPALIPLAGQIAGAVGAIGISFGAAGIAAGAFGVLAGNVLSSVGQNAQKLSTLEQKLNSATTAAQRKSAEQQIAALKATWSKGYLALIGNYQDFKDQWTRVSQSIAVPALNAWLPALTKGLQFLKPVIQPVADLFKSWGQSLNTYFSNPVTALRIRNIAAAFGDFAAIQLGQIAKFTGDIAKGFFNLGKDLVGSGANLGAAGTGLMHIGDAFLNWSKSAKARADVNGFLRFLHTEGPVINGILKDLGTLLPGIFAAATTVGTLELKALGNFLNLVASLPPGWQKPVTEFAGAMLLLSKIGVVKVGLKLTGLEGALAIPGLAGAGSAGGPFAVAGAAMAAGVVLKFREDLKTGLKNSAGAIGHDLAMVFSGLGGFAATGAQGLADTLVNHFSKQARQGFHDTWHAIAASFATFRHDMSASFGAFRDDIVSSFRAGWHDIVASFATFRHTMSASFDAFRHTMSASFAALRHDIAHTFDVMRHDIAAAWDTIWRNTVTRVRNGISDVVTWFRNMPGRVLSALTGLGTDLYNFGHMALSKLWNGMKNVFGSVWNWFKSLPGKLLHAIGINSPPDWAIDAGKHIMGGILHGITSRKAELQNAFRGAVGSGAIGGDALANQRLARRIFPWPANQWAPFVSLVMAESGFNRYARNPSSGAYGIAQALPPTKYPFAGQAAGGSHAGPQLSWMFSYIRGRYGTPANAWGHELAYHWYDRGGWLPAGASLAFNATGRPERVLGPGERPGNVTYNVTINVPPGANKAAIGREYVHAIREYERSSGSGWRR